MHGRERETACLMMAGMEYTQHSWAPISSSEVEPPKKGNRFVNFFKEERSFIDTNRFNPRGLKKCRCELILLFFFTGFLMKKGFVPPSGLGLGSVDTLSSDRGPWKRLSKCLKKQNIVRS